jgi:hypothetical protein
LSISKFAVYYFILLAITGSIFLALQKILMPTVVLIPYFWLVFAFMAVITLMVYAVSFIGLKAGGDNQAFIMLAAIVIRLLFSMFFVLFYLSNVKVNGLLFIANFFSIYFLFTAFEIYCLLRNLRHQIKK